MTNTEWTMLSLVSQHQLPGAFNRLASAGRHARRFWTRRSDTANTAVRPVAAAAAAGVQAGLSVKSHACVSCEPPR